MRLALIMPSGTSLEINLWSLAEDSDKGPDCFPDLIGIVIHINDVIMLLIMAVVPRHRPWENSIGVLSLRRRAGWFR